MLDLAAFQIRLVKMFSQCSGISEAFKYRSGDVIILAIPLSNVNTSAGYLMLFIKMIPFRKKKSSEIKKHIIGESR